MKQQRAKVEVDPDFCLSLRTALAAAHVLECLSGGWIPAVGRAPEPALCLLGLPARRQEHAEVRLGAPVPGLGRLSEPALCLLRLPAAVTTQPGHARVFVKWRGELP